MILLGRAQRNPTRLFAACFALVVTVAGASWSYGQSETTKGGERLADLHQDLVDLQSEDARVAGAALRSLVKKGRQVAPAILPLLVHKDPLIRQRGLAILERVGAAEAGEAITERLDDDDAAVRAAAVRALKAIGEHAATPKLAALLHDPDSRVRIETMFTLSAFGHIQMTDLLKQRIRGRALPDGERLAAIAALGVLRSNDALGDLLTVLRDPGEAPKTRGTAARALAEIGDQQAVPSIIQLLRHDNPVARFNAAWSLAGFAGKDAEGALAAVAQDEREETYVRARAAWSLGLLGSGTALAVVTDIARHGSELMRLYAVRVLVLTGAAGASEEAARLARDARDDFVRASAQALLRGEDPTRPME